MDAVERYVERPMRLLEYVLFTFFAAAIAIATMSWILDDFVTDGWSGILIAAVSISLMQMLVLPIAYRMIRWMPPIVFPFLVFAATGFIVLLAAWLDDELGIDAFELMNLETAIWVALGLTAITTILGTLFSLDDVKAYDRYVTQPIKGVVADSATKTDVPAFLFLEIDGLAGPLLQKAMDEGYAPNMKAWMDQGGYELTIWEPDLSCQTGASQAGILLGNNHNIPAFRWWDKRTQELMVVSSRSSAKQLEAELSQGTGLLQLDGASRFNVFTGGASDSIGTFSNLSFGAGSARYWAYFLNPYSFARLLSLFVQDIFREWWEEFQQKRERVEPRLARPWTYAFVRSGTTAAQLEVGRFMVIADLFRGVPSAYYTFFAYDEMAHHTGIDRHYTFKVLKNMDRIFGHIQELTKDAPRPTHLIVLSDHGQTMGATFLQRYGLSLSDLVEQSLPSGESVQSILSSNESTAHFNATFTEIANSDSRAGNLTSRLLKGQMEDGEVVIGEDADALASVADGEVIVLASGNLGLISFTKWKERMTLAQITRAFPELVQGLVSHPGVGFVMIKDEEDGGVVIGDTGVYFLDTDTFEGENPLEPYGSLAPQLLRRTNGFDTCPDILAISTYWPETGENAAFEELIGNHGGLGGLQRHPFVFHPREFSLGDELIVGCADLNAALRGWIEAEQKPENALTETTPDLLTDVDAKPTVQG